VHTTAAATDVTVGGSPPWSAHLGTAGCTCIRFTCERARDGDPWLLSRVVSELVATGAAMAERPRAIGRGHGMPLVHSQAMTWCGTTLELESHHLRDGGDDEVSVLLPSWDELAVVVPEEDALWEMLDLVAAAIIPRFGIIGDGESIGATRCESAADMRALLRRHIGVLAHTYSLSGPMIEASVYRALPRSGLTAVIR
jgi:hypothetical protein